VLERANLEAVVMADAEVASEHVGWDDRGSIRPCCAGWAGGIGSASGGGKREGNPTPKPNLIGRPTTALLLVRAVWQGQDSNL
jgi:hypothetical protein